MIQRRKFFTETQANNFACLGKITLVQHPSRTITVTDSKTCSKIDARPVQKESGNFSGSCSHNQVMIDVRQLQTMYS